MAQVVSQPSGEIERLRRQGLLLDKAYVGGRWIGGDSAATFAVRNATPYGLAAYFYSRGVGRIWRVSEALEYGTVGINTGFISTEVAPIGGMKESGIGREGSKYGIDEWLEIEYLAMGGIDE